MRSPLTTLLILPLLAGCLSQVDEGEVAAAREGLTAAQRRARAGEIRDAAELRGMSQGWLLAGIADAETQMSHCWSELTWACQGPTSPDCGGGPIVAGAGDGPCSLRQGGLGMFQFDAGTFDDTIAREGARILTIAGNTDAAVDFVIDMVIRSTFITGVTNEVEAIDWMNDVRTDNALLEPWAQTVTRYYNGCQPGWSCWASRLPRYRDFAVDVYDEMGASFWDVAFAPPVDPPDGGTPPPPPGTEYGAEFVTQTFPRAGAPFTLVPGGEKLGYFELRNTGTETWSPGFTFLGTVEPRDGESPLYGPDWTAPNRAASVETPVPPGEVGRFGLTLRAPNAEGVYPQAFNLVEEGVGWFSDIGSAPRDGDISIVLTVALDGDPGDPPGGEPPGGPIVEDPPPLMPGDGRLRSGCNATGRPIGSIFGFAVLSLFALFTRRRRARV